MKILLTTLLISLTTKAHASSAYQCAGILISYNNETALMKDLSSSRQFRVPLKFVHIDDQELMNKNINKSVNYLIDAVATTQGVLCSRTI